MVVPASVPADVEGRHHAVRGRGGRPLRQAPQGKEMVGGVQSREDRPSLGVVLLPSSGETAVEMPSLGYSREQ